MHANAATHPLSSQAATTSPQQSDQHRSISEVLVWVLGVILALVAAAVWCLMHLPSATLAPGGSGLTITNTGLPLTNARVVATYRDGQRATIPMGRLPRGEHLVPIPPGFATQGIKSVSINAELFGMGVAAHSALEF